MTSLDGFRYQQSPLTKPLEQSSPREKRLSYVDRRILWLEDRRKRLGCVEKWPIRRSVAQHQKRAVEGPESGPAPALAETPIPSKCSEDLATVQHDDLEFPFPITKPGQLRSFPQFFALPIELRLEIWEWAVRSLSLLT